MGLRTAMVTIVLVAELLPSLAFATNLPGDLDLTFGTNGFNTATSGSSDSNVALAIDGSGKIVAGGYATIGGTSVFNVTRYLTSGALDTSFGTGGDTDVTPGTNDSINAITQDSAGNILAAGHATIGGNYVFALARYLPSGALDTSFGSNGFVTTSLGTHADFNAISVGSNGKIIAAGVAIVGGTIEFALARYLPSGTLDS